jgi:hypothetical protein
MKPAHSCHFAANGPSQLSIGTEVAPAMQLGNTLLQAETGVYG